MFGTSENAMVDQYEPHINMSEEQCECPYEVYSSIDEREVFGFGTYEQALEYIRQYRADNIGEDGEFTDCLVIFHGSDYEIYSASEYYKSLLAA